MRKMMSLCRSQLSKGYSPSLTLRLEQRENVVDPNGALDVTDDATTCIVEELNPDLGDTTTRAGAAEDL